MIKIGSLWRYQKGGNPAYYKGHITEPAPADPSAGVDVLLFESKSTHENAPAFDMLIAKSRPKPEGGAGEKEKPSKEDGDDIPF